MTIGPDMDDSDTKLDLASAKAERDSDQINKSFGAIVRGLRQKAGLTLEQLSLASQVSRAMLSSVERGEKSPTLSVLAGIANGLNVTMSDLMGDSGKPAAATVIRRDQRLVFHDRGTGIERHLLSPTHLSSGIELVEHRLPPGQVFDAVLSHSHSVEKYVIVRSGQLTVEIGEMAYVLAAEDAMHFQASQAYRFVNRSQHDCSYYIFIVHKPANR
jgi:transcriptional regulator with XRE-family HTH domain